MLLKLKIKIFGALRAVLISLGGMRRGIMFSPLASVSPNGRIDLSRRVSVKRGVLNSSNGDIVLSEGVWLNNGVEINSINQIFIGMGTTIQRNGTINGEIHIGSECLFAPNVFLSSTTHVHDFYPGVGIREQERRISRVEFLERYNKPIVIGDDVWLGVNVVVMPGVTIGSHVVIGANSVVNMDIPSGVIAAGVPARIIKERPGFSG